MSLKKKILIFSIYSIFATFGHATQQEFINAVVNHDVAKVRSYFKKNSSSLKKDTTISLDYLFDYGTRGNSTALIAAVRSGDLDIMGLLLRAGADISVTDNNGQGSAALDYAIKFYDATPNETNKAILIELIRKSSRLPPSVKTVNNGEFFIDYMYYYLHKASSINSYQEIIEEREYSDDQIKLLFTPSISFQNNLFDWYIDQCTKVNKSIVKIEDIFENYALAGLISEPGEHYLPIKRAFHQALLYKQFSLAEFFIASGFDITSYGFDTASMLHLSLSLADDLYADSPQHSVMPSSKMIRLLLSKKVDGENINKEGQTAFEVLINFEYPKGKARGDVISIYEMQCQTDRAVVDSIIEFLLAGYIPSDEHLAHERVKEALKKLLNKPFLQKELIRNPDREINQRMFAWHIPDQLKGYPLIKALLPQAEVPLNAIQAIKTINANLESGVFVIEDGKVVLNKNINITFK